MGNIGTVSLTHLDEYTFVDKDTAILAVRWKDDLMDVLQTASNFKWILPPYKVEDTFASSQVITHLGNQLASRGAETKLLIPLCGLTRQHKGEWLYKYRDNDMFFPRSRISAKGTATYCRELMWEGFEFQERYVVYGEGLYPFDYYRVNG